MRFFDNRSEIHPFISRGFRANHGVSLKMQVLSFSHPMGPVFLKKIIVLLQIYNETQSEWLIDAVSSLQILGLGYAEISR